MSTSLISPDPEDEAPAPIRGDIPTSPPPTAIPVRFVVVRPIVSYILIGVTVIIYLLQVITEHGLGIDFPTLLMVKYNPLIQSGELWRLITPIFLHGSLMHIGFNMYALFALGPSLEQEYGHKNFLILYFIGGIAGNVLSFIMSPNPSLGASTAIFGLIAAQLIFVYINRAFFGQKARSMLINILAIILINLTLGLTPGIDNWGHLGGLVGGLAFAWFAGPVLQVERHPNELVIANQRPVRQAWITFLVEFLILTAISIIVIFIRSQA